jgi:hypothetical protein
MSRTLSSASERTEDATAHTIHFTDWQPSELRPGKSDRTQYSTINPVPNGVLMNVKPNRSFTN